MGRDIFIRTLDNQVTVYDEEGNVVNQIPPLPKVPPETRYVNIEELENKLMGTDSDAKPDFFIDVANSELFREVEEEPELQTSVKHYRYHNVLELICYLLLFTGSVVAGYLLI